MAVLDIRLFGDPVLRQQANEVTDFDDRLRRLAADMTETMVEASGVGLAATQVGILKRLFTWNVEEEDGALVNPVLLASSEDVQEGDEGCLSFPGLFYPVRRPLRIEVAYRDLDGEALTREAEGFLARVFLHEMDHLNGVLFIDHLARHDRKEAMRRMRELRDGAPAAASQGGSLLGRAEG